MTAIGEPISIKPGETTTSTVLCYASTMSAGEAQKQIALLFDSASNHGFTMIKVICSDPIRLHNGAWVENKLRNKIKLILKKAEFMDEEIPEVYNDLVKFFKTRVNK